MRATRLAGLAAPAVLAGLALTACGSSGPSAQCQSQVTRIVALQADARLISGSSAPVSGSLLSQYNSDIASSGALLSRVKAEGCPVSGYKGGYNLR